MGKAHLKLHVRSYIPNTMFLWLIIQLLMTIKPAHKILSLTYRNCWGKPNKWILPPLFQKNKYGRSQLYWDQIFSRTIYLCNRKFDWCLIVDPIWLVWHTYISHWSTHWTAHNIPDAPTKRYFFTKNNSKRKQILCTIGIKMRRYVIKVTFGLRRHVFIGLATVDCKWWHNFYATLCVLEAFCSADKIT